MSIADRNGKIIKHVSDTGVDRVFVSQASREMANGGSFKTAREQDKAASEIRRVIDSINREKIELQNELGKVTAHIRGKRLNQEFYRSLCDQQISLKDQLADAIKRGQMAKEDLRHVSMADAQDLTVTMTGMSRRLDEIEALILKVISIVEKIPTAADSSLTG